MVANDDLKGKTTYFTGFYDHTISGPKIPKGEASREQPVALTRHQVGFFLFFTGGKI